MDTVIFGLSLTTWLVILGVFAIVTPIVGKQVAKDSIKVKNSLQEPSGLGFILFPKDALEGRIVSPTAPVQTLEDKDYIFRMMTGGVWVKFLNNVLDMTILLVMAIIGFIFYSAEALFRGIFSTK